MSGVRLRLKREEGSITIVAAAVLFLAVVLALVATDVLNVLKAKARAQTAADAAALAAAQELALPSGLAPKEAAAEYARRNGARLVSCACVPGSRDASVEVEAHARLIFLPGERLVRGSARAVVELGVSAAGP